MTDGAYYTRIRQSVKAFETDFEQTRRDRMHIVAHMAGPYFGEDETGNRPDDGEMPLPLTAMNALSWMIHLTNGRARTLVGCTRTGREFKTRKIRLFLDDMMNRFGWSEFESRFVLDAIVGPFGFAKVGRTSAHGAYGGADLYIDTVSADDLVYDSGAKRWNPAEHEYIGHRFTCTREDLLDSGVSKKKLDEVQSLKRRDNTERSEDLFRGMKEDGREWLSLYELHLPQRGEIIVVDADGPFVPLDVKPGKLGEDVPPTGLYAQMTFNRMPDTLIGAGLLSGSFDESRNANSAQVKYIKSVLAAARFLTTNAASEADAKAIKEARDGDCKVVVGNKDSVQDRTRGAPDAGAFSASQTSTANFDRASHGMSTRLGMDAGADTATEVNARSAASSAVGRYFRRIAHEAKEDVLRKICWWAYHKLPNLAYPIRDENAQYTLRTEDFKRHRSLNRMTGTWEDSEPVAFDEYEYRMSVYGGEPLEARDLLAIQSQMLAEYMQAPQLFAQQQIVPDLQAMQRNKKRWTGVEGVEGMDDIFVYTSKEIDTEGMSGAPQKKTGGQTYFRTARNGKQDGMSDTLAMANMMSQGNEAAA